ncbi:hypothetical protein NIES4101_67380 [Calothrix sp. NIES-4101]|nr:hypothetical protein NIES4101_67380 [Calothrix sp. NIES-4101]
MMINDGKPNDLEPIYDRRLFFPNKQEPILDELLAVVGHLLVEHLVAEPGCVAHYSHVVE